VPLAARFRVEQIDPRHQSQEQKMSELDTIEQKYLAKEGYTAQQDGSVPADFREKRDKLKADPAARAADAKVRLDHLRRFLEQLDSADNENVKRQKRIVMRWEINALREIEKM
jgi:hypothetical protein